MSANNPNEVGEYITQGIHQQMAKERAANEKLREDTKDLVEQSNQVQDNIQNWIDESTSDKGVNPVIDAISDTLIEAGGGVVKSGLGMVTGLGSQAVTVATGIDNKLTEGIDWLFMSKEEKTAKKAAEEKQKAEEAAALEAAEAAALQAQEQEAIRMAVLQNMYAVHGAAITCSCAVRPSSVVVPIGHGVYIHGIDQLHIGDCIPNTNILNFGLCNSASNPKVQEVAEEMIASVKKEHEKGVWGWVKKTFFRVDADISANDMQCVADCIMKFGTKWLNGADDVYVEGQKAVLGRCRLQCIYGGEVAFYTSGQIE